MGSMDSMDSSEHSTNATVSSATNSFRWAGPVTTPYPGDKIIGDDARQVWYVILKCAMYGVFSLFGIVTNVITLAVFGGMGCDDSASVTLISLTLSDLLGLVVLFWMGMCYNPWVVYSDVPFDTLSVVYLSGGWPKIYISRVTSWITAFVAVERCLCIELPLRVRTILTRRRSAFINAALFLLIFLMMPPIYYTTGLDWQWFPDRNKTLLGLSFTPERDGVYDAVASVNIVLAYVSFVVIVVCTLVLVYVLRKQTLWRSSASATEKSSSVSMKELRASKMVLLITLIFLVCYLPGTALLLVMIFVPEFNKGMFYNNLFTVVWAFVHLMEALNSSVNLFVYRRLSSRFKAVQSRMFHCPRGELQIEIQNQDKSKF